MSLTSTRRKKRRGQQFTASGTFVVPSGVTEVSILAVGGGGGGGCGSSYSAGGGGGGGVVRKRATVTPGESLTITVGAGGAGGTSAAPLGAKGGNTTVSFADGQLPVEAGGGGPGNYNGTSGDLNVNFPQYWPSGGGGGGSNGNAGSGGGGGGGPDACEGFVDFPIRARYGVYPFDPYRGCGGQGADGGYSQAISSVGGDGGLGSYGYGYGGGGAAQGGVAGYGYGVNGGGNGADSTHAAASGAANSGGGGGGGNPNNPNGGAGGSGRVEIYWTEEAL